MLLPAWVSAFVVGLTVGLCAPAWAVVALAAGAALVFVVCLRRRAVVVGGGAAATMAGLLAGAVASAPGALSGPLEAAVGGDGAVVVEGVVVRRLGAPPGRARLLVACQRVAGSAAHGGIGLGIIDGDGPAWSGDRIAFRARIAEPLGLANPGLPDARLTARAMGIDAVASVRAGAEIRVLERGRWFEPRRLAERLHEALGKAVDQRLSGEAAGFVRGVVLGDRSALGEHAEQAFRAAGATHVLSVSGLHLTAVAGVLFLLLRRGALWLPWAGLTWRPAPVAAAVAFAGAVLYTLITGEAVATWRSALMAAAVFGGVIVGRPAAIAPAIALSALLLLIEQPLQLLDVSFQLSFASLIALVIAARAFPGSGRSDSRWRRAVSWVRTSLVVSTAVFLLTAPIVAHHFGELSPASPLGNLVLVPLVEMGVVPIGLLGATLGALHPVLGALPRGLAGGIARLVLFLAAGFRAAAPILPVRSPSVLETLGLVAGGLLLMWFWTARRRRGVLLGGLAALGIAFVSLVARDLARRWRSDLEITFLDVGQGDAALVQGPGGFTALVDGGGAVEGLGGGDFDPGARVIEPLLRRRGIARLDLVILSHPHPDHLNGLHRIIERFDVDALWTSGDDGRNPEYRRLVEAARARGVALPRPARLLLGPLSLEPLGPWQGGQIAAPPGLSVNDASLVVQLRFGGRGVLFTGDIEAQGEAELAAQAARGLTVTSDVLKVPHHGSRTSSTQELLGAVRPYVAVVSLGRRNRFGFPHAEVLRRYEERRTHLLRTDLHGAITLVIDPSGASSIACARSCPEGGSRR